MKITQNGRKLQLEISKRYGVEVPVEDCTKLCRLAQTLHTQSENVCNYERAATPAYAKRCENAEKRLKRLAADFALVGLDVREQGDPRGCAVKVGRLGTTDGWGPIDDGWAAVCVGQVGLL